MKPTYEELEHERNELAAQVERLRGEITSIMEGSSGVTGRRWNGEIAHWVEFYDLAKMLSEPPSAALSVLRAEAGRDGFIRGYFYSRQYGFQFEEELEAAADRYFNYITQRIQDAQQCPPR